MDMNIIHTIKPKKYSELIEASRANALTPEQLQEVITALREHQALTSAALKLRNRQLKTATGLLGALEKGSRLFPEPDKDPEDPTGKENSEENSDKTEDSPKPKSPPKRLQRKPSKVIQHKMELSALTCPCCKKNMHRAHKKTVTILRIDGFSEERHEMETARCLTCNTKSEATGPTEKTILQFSIRAASVITSLRYAYGLPSYRLEEVSLSMGYRIPDSTQWDLFEAVATELLPFHRFLKKEAAKATVVQTDDTTARINQMTIEIALAKMEGRELERTGVHTTGFIAKIFNGSDSLGKICLFESGIHHAGEFFEKIMKAKTTAEKVILMVDASTSNTCKIPLLSTPVIQVNCNSHAFRKFDEYSENPLFAEDVGEILKLYKNIFAREQETKNLSPQQRFELHQKESLPEMLKIKEKIESDFRLCLVEPNSTLAGAYKYFLNHFEKLCAFCKTPNAPLCNNETERLLKRAIRHRKNSLFYRTLIGAAVGDIQMSILMTAKENNIEPVQYLCDLLTYIDRVRANPHDWLPWNYLKTKDALFRASAVST
jgi:transposase